MKFFGLDYSKHKLMKEKPTLMDETYKLVEKIWTRLPIDFPPSVMSAWKKSCLLLQKVDGDVLTHLQNIRY